MERIHKTTLILTRRTFVFLALICQATYAQEGEVEDGPVSLLQRRAVNPRLKPGLSNVTDRQQPQKSISYIVKQRWDGEKPHLLVPQKKTITPSTRTGAVDPQHALQDTHQGGCKECFRKIHNLSDLCRFEFALRVRPIEKQKHRYVAKILSVYRDSPKLSLEPDTLIKLHLAETVEQPLAINKDLSRCSCPYLRPNVSYILFGRASRQHHGVVTVLRAHRFSSNRTIANYTEARLRLVASICSPPNAIAPTGPTDQVHMTLNSTASTSTITTGSVKTSVTGSDRTGEVQALRKQSHQPVKKTQ